MGWQGIHRRRVTEQPRRTALAEWATILALPFIVLTFAWTVLQVPSSAVHEGRAHLAPSLVPGPFVTSGLRPRICYPRASSLLPSCYMERRTESARWCAVMRGYAPEIPANQFVLALSCDVLRSSRNDGHGWFRTTDLSRVKQNRKNMRKRKKRL